MGDDFVEGFLLLKKEIALIMGMAFNSSSSFARYILSLMVLSDLRITKHLGSVCRFLWRF